jgi:hypothetical protein
VRNAQEDIDQVQIEEPKTGTKCYEISLLCGIVLHDNLQKIRDQDKIPHREDNGVVHCTGKAKPFHGVQESGIPRHCSAETVPYRQ